MIRERSGLVVRDDQGEIVVRALRTPEDHYEILEGQLPERLIAILDARG